MPLKLTRTRHTDATRVYIGRAAPGVWQHYHIEENRTQPHQVGPQYQSKLEALADHEDYLTRAGWMPADDAAEDRTLMYRAEIDAPADDTPCACEDCSWRGTFSQLRDIDDCSLTPGDASPAGRCPECETLAYVVKPTPEGLTDAQKLSIANEALRTILAKAQEHNQTTGFSRDSEIALIARTAWNQLNPIHT